MKLEEPLLILFCSNYFTHHQKPISEQLSTLTNGNYAFFESKKMSVERIKLGWRNGTLPKYVRYIGDVPFATNPPDADILIAGSFPEELLQPYIKANTLLFRYSERPLKDGDSLLKYPLRFWRFHHYNPIGKSIYLLCASAYTSLDYRKFGLFKSSAYKWGYFPEMRRYSDVTDVLKRKNPKRILWAGRFLDWKRPNDAIQAAFQLKVAGLEFQMDFIGAGPMENTMRRMISAMGLSECVRILDAMPPEQVRNEMENCGIYLLTSDRHEGWGAVLNESMNSGCAVVASHLAGGVPYLIQHEKNGLVYETGQVEQLCKAIQHLLESPETQQSYGRNAYKTIVSEWNAEVAAKRFVNLANHILGGDMHPDLYSTGPCSRADVIEESWFKN